MLPSKSFPRNESQTRVLMAMELLNPSIKFRNDGRANLHARLCLHCLQLLANQNTPIEPSP